MPVAIYHQASTFFGNTWSAVFIFATCLVGAGGRGGLLMELPNTEGNLPSHSALSPLGLDELSSFYHEVLVPLLASKSDVACFWTSQGQQTSQGSVNLVLIKLAFFTASNTHKLGGGRSDVS